MSVRKNLTKFAIEKEDTEGVYKAPQGDTSFVETTEDGATLEGSKELVERNVMTGNRVRRDLRLGRVSCSGSVPVEAKAGETEGSAPKFTEMLEAAGFGISGLGARKSTGTGHSTTIIYMADTSGIKANDIVTVKESEVSANSDHVSPVASVDTNVSVTLLLPADNAFSDNVELAKSSLFKIDQTVDVTLSATKIYEGDESELRGLGLRTSNVQLQNWTTGQIPQFLFDLVGLNFEDKLNSSAFTPSYDDSQPPLILGACIYKGTSVLELNEFSLAIQNDISIKPSVCSKTGNVSSNGTGKYVVSGSMNPYKEKDAIDFKLDESEFSIFGFAYNPNASDETEFNNIIAFHIPKAKIISKVDAEVEGHLTDSLSFQATPDSEDDSICFGLF
jgi:hypothetical protein